ncbi:hypothetical protein NP233_g2197 [Leucocoprinus birnbaumii]|uniref:DUF6533 domain-containing protein n=1 Tax=Leucocoprinus birnbaumii TaxID=56174 RepID=A0AAD5VZB0_9AGAR|nr:hypothetical protein NP233_g2197 [Leucocoprinus birnbaumii]
MGSLLEVLAREVQQGLRDVQATRYAQLASCCIIVYDHLLTLDSELDLIWRSSWSFGKALFIINRYYTLSSVIFNNYALFSSSLTDNVRFSFTKFTGCYSFPAVAPFQLSPILSMARMDRTDSLHDCGSHSTNALIRALFSEQKNPGLDAYIVSGRFEYIRSNYGEGSSVNHCHGKTAGISTYSNPFGLHLLRSIPCLTEVLHLLDTDIDKRVPSLCSGFNQGLSDLPV